MRDGESNTISAFNLLEDITADGFPLLVPRVAFFTLWEREEGDAPVHHARLSVSLDNQELLAQPLDIDFQGFRKNRTINRIGGLVLPGPGQLRFSLAIDGGTTATYTVPVTLSAQAPHVEVQADAH